MYIQGRTVQKWSNLIKSLRDEVHLLAGLRISRLVVSETRFQHDIVTTLLRCEMLASKQMHFASAITLIDDRP